MLYQRSSQLFAEAEKVIPGGVNSPVRAFKAVGGTPIFVKSAKGAYLLDEDGNRLIDYINSWGPMILGHAYEPVVEAVIEVIVLPKVVAPAAPIFPTPEPPWLIPKAVEFPA